MKTFCFISAEDDWQIKKKIAWQLEIISNNYIKILCGQASNGKTKMLKDKTFLKGEQFCA